MKKLIAFILVFTMMLPLTGCDMDSIELPGFMDELIGASGECKHNPEKTFNAPKLRIAEVTLDAGSVTITCSCGKEVTGGDLDSVAYAKYDKNFKKCSGEEKLEVQRLYAIYKGVHRNMAEIYLKLDPDNTTEKLDNWDVADSAISNAGTAFSLLNLYGEMRDKEKLANVFGTLESGTDIAGNVFKVVQTIVYCKELSGDDNLDPKNFSRMCIINLKNITSFIPVYDDYFSQCLDAIATGMDVLIENYQKHDEMLKAYDAALDPKSSGRLTGKRWEIATKPDWWDDLGNHTAMELSLADIVEHYEDLNGVSEMERKYMEGYILARLKYELGS